MGKWKFQTLQISSSTSIMKDRVGPQLRQLLINGSLDWQPLTHQYRPAALQYMTPESWQPEAIQSTFQRYRKPDDVGGWAQLCVCNYWLQSPPSEACLWQYRGEERETGNVTLVLEILHGTDTGYVDTTDDKIERRACSPTPGERSWKWWTDKEKFQQKCLHNWPVKLKGQIQAVA